MDAIELRNSLAALHSASFAWAMVCCRDRERAEDLLQTVYIKVLSSKSPYRGKSSFRTWLFAVIRNGARDQSRKRWWSRAVRIEVDSLEQFSIDPRSQDDWGHEPCEIQKIRAAVEALPGRQREIAHLVFYENMAVTDAACAMGVSIGTARQHYARAKKSLTNALQSLLTERYEATRR